MKSCLEKSHGRRSQATERVKEQDWLLSVSTLVAGDMERTVGAVPELIRRNVVRRQKWSSFLR
jgi:hypothetical protein